jgi:hypothetical protein
VESVDNPWGTQQFKRSTKSFMRSVGLVPFVRNTSMVVSLNKEVNLSVKHVRETLKSQVPESVAVEARLAEGEAESEVRSVEVEVDLEGVVEVKLVAVEVESETVMTVEAVKSAEVEVESVVEVRSVAVGLVTVKLDRWGCCNGARTEQKVTKEWKSLTSPKAGLMASPFVH